MKRTVYNLLLMFCLITTVFAGCKSADAPVTEATEPETQVASEPITVAAETVPTEIEIVDAPSLAQNCLQSLTTKEQFQLSYNVKTDGILGTAAGEYYTEVGIDARRYFNDPDWEEYNYYSVRIGAKYNSVIEDFKLVDNTCYYKNSANQAWAKNTSGITPMSADGLPGITLLNQIASGAVVAEYSASPEEGHIMTLSLSGGALRQFMKDYFPGLVGSNGIPENADWNSVNAEVRIRASIYSGCPDLITVTSDDLAELLICSLSGAEYMNVESNELRCTVFHGSTISKDDELKMAVQAPIPQPTMLKNLFEQTIAEAGTPLNPPRTAAPVQVPTPTEASPAVTVSPSASVPAAPAPTQAPVSDGFVPPAVFEPVKTTDDITLYLDNGSHVTLSYPSDSSYFDNAQFNQGGSYYTTISCDLSVGSGYAKFTLQDLTSAEEYLDMQIDRFRKNASADDNRLSNQIGDIQTVTVNGMEVSFVEMSYITINAFKKQVTMECCFGVTQVGGSFLCLEFSNGYGERGSKVDFDSPAEFLFSHVK